MIKNLLRTALRAFGRDKSYSLLNILGLSIGITFSLFLIFYITDELSYDRYNEKADRIYRIASYIQEKDKATDWAITQMPLAGTLKRDYPEVEQSARFQSKERTLFKNRENSFYETKAFYADSTVFNIFTYPFVEGSAKTALTEPNSIVLSKTEADKYFGEGKPAVGKTLRTVYDVYKVTGVVKDVPRNSHLRFDMLISMSTLTSKDKGLENWGGFYIFTYVLLKPGADANVLEKKMAPLYDKYMAPIFAQYGVKIRYGVQRVTDVHLHSKLQNEPEELGSMSYIWIFATVAFFMLLIACINYMNLTTARSARRAKEIGMRKVMGSARKGLVAQFLTESVLTSFIAVAVSMVLVLCLLHSFNSISGKSFGWTTLFEPFNLMLLVGIGLFTGLVGGSYPALYLSGFQPISILKGTLSKASGNINLRRTLVVLQFSISMIMLICTWVVYAQLQYLQRKDLGFDKDYVMTVTINTGEDERSKIMAMNNEVRTLPGVKEVGTANAYPGQPNINLNLFHVQTDSGYTDKGINCYAIDEHYLPALGIQIAKGRNFASAADTLRSIVVNEAMVKHFGWKEPIGKRVTYPGDTSSFYLEVVGVVKDFNQKSLYNPIEPLLFYYGPNSNVIQVKLTGGEIAPTLAKVEKAWKKYFPQLPFEYKFLDADYNSQYAADQKRGKIFAAFSVLTILITSLGLLGLTAFTTQQRQKEISIRRVLGASISQVVVLTTKNYLLLAVIAAAIAFPIAWYFMDSWLQIFSYNTGLSLVPFVVSACIILATAAATAGFYSAKAAVTNPSKNLRAE